MDSPLKWPGGKRRVAPQIVELYRQTGRPVFLDLFGGSGSVAFHVDRGAVVYNDLNAHVVNFFVQVRAGLQPDPDLVPWEYDEDVYYCNRTRFNQLIRTYRHRTPEAALLFLYLNKCGYNGLVRFNQRGEYNVSFGTHKGVALPADFDDLRAAVSTWSMNEGHWAGIEKTPEMFVYADPPYDGGFTAYTRSGFDWSDQEWLARNLAQHPGPVLAMNAATPRIIDLYAGLGFKVETVDAHRSISCTGDRRPAAEIVATNF